MQLTTLATAAAVFAVGAMITPAVLRTDFAALAATKSETAVPMLVEDGKARMMQLAGYEPEPEEPIAFEKLVRVDDSYDVQFSDSVSKQVQAVRMVTKIGYGKTDLVTIVTTPTGTYSTDGLKSPNVLYPGVEVSRSGDTAMWVHGSGWMPMAFVPAHSVVTRGQIRDGGRFVAGKGRTCFSGRNFVSCD